MGLTVKQLITKLRKCDKDAIVAWQAHDQSEDECDGWVGSVSTASQSLLDAENEQKIVVLRG